MMSNIFMALGLSCSLAVYSTKYKKYGFILIEQITICINKDGTMETFSIVTWKKINNFQSMILLCRMIFLLYILYANSLHVSNSQACLKNQESADTLGSCSWVEMDQERRDRRKRNI